MKKIVALVLALLMIFALCGCKAFTKTKIGLVLDFEGLNENLKGANDYALEGLNALGKKYVIVYKESKNSSEYEGNIKALIDEKCDLIICSSYRLADDLLKVAAENPDQKFAILDDNSIELPNVANLVFSHQDIGFLAGIVAGNVTKSNVVGFVQAVESDSYTRYGVGFIAGVSEANKDAKYILRNANSSGNITKGLNLAKELKEAGADIIFEAALVTGQGVVSGCTQNSIWAIGYDKDLSYLSLDYVLTSAIKNYDVAVADIAKAVRDDKFEAGERLFNIKNGGVGITTSNSKLTQEVKDAVDAAIAKVKDGSIEIPFSPIQLNDYVLE